MPEPADIADLGDELDGGDVPEAVHGTHGVVLGQRAHKAQHLSCMTTSVSRAVVSALTAATTRSFVLAFLSRMVKWPQLSV